MPIIRNPAEWIAEQFGIAANQFGHSAYADNMRRARRWAKPPVIYRIGMADLWIALRKGVQDFGALRTDVIFLCLGFPVLGLVLARFAVGAGLIQLVFPLASGFALIGPVAALGLYEMSRRREQTGEAKWSDAFRVLRAPSLGAMTILILVLLALFALWIAAAQLIYTLTLGPELPASNAAFFRDVFTTGAGWAMIAIGIGVGAVFAMVSLTIGVLSFPLMLERNVRLTTAVQTSLRAVAKNPGPMALWGLIVAGGLVIGSLPALLGLVIVFPVLGHATWHLYRQVVLPHPESGDSSGV
ncbi:MAG: DUF2189 domain-containing protein [Alphaproteobacteria bacterium]